MAKYRVKFNQGRKRKIVTGVFYSKSKANRIAKIINKRKEKSNARVSKIIK